jgi:hypothetical protein
MAKTTKMRQEYDFSSGVRGKYMPRLAKGANVVVLDRDMGKVFPSSKAVNDALRFLAEAERRHGNAKVARAAFEQSHVIKAPMKDSSPMVKSSKRLFICLDNAGYEVSIERLKIYIALTEVKTERAGYLRIIDESGEGYLYPSQRFVAAKLPVATRRAVLRAA